MRKQIAFVLSTLLLAVVLFSGCAPASGTTVAAAKSAAPVTSAAATKAAATATAAATEAATTTDETTASTPAEATTGKVAGQKWIDSGIVGNVTAGMTTDPTDDFALYVNRDWASSTKIPEGKAEVCIATEREDEVKNEVLKLIKSGEAKSHEAKLVKQFYADATNMTARNKAGVDPVKPYVKEILAIKDLKDLSKFVSDGDGSIISSSLLSVGVLGDLKDSSRNAVYITPEALTLQDSAEYANMTTVGKLTKQAAETEYVAYLGRFGVSESEAKTRFEALIALETELATTIPTAAEQHSADYTQKIYNPMSISELQAAAGNYPIVEILKPYTKMGVDKFVVTSKEWLKKMSSVYTEKNVEAFKDLVLYRLEANTATLLDQKCFDMNDKYDSTVQQSTIKTDIEESTYISCSKYLDWAIGKMYCEGYATKDIKDDITNMSKEFIAAFRKRVEAADWLTDATKKKALEKLDNITIKAVYPDDWTPYEMTDLKFKSSADGGSYFDDMLSIFKYKLTESAKNAAKPVDKTKWAAVPQTVNACYNKLENSINICAGILGGGFYNKDWSIEKKLGSIGAFIGHEITHGFDSGGSQFDKDGNMANWWTEEDMEAFSARTKKVADYFSTFEPIAGVKVNGDMDVTEAVADLGGMATSLDMAKSIKNFDYKVFFKTWAETWRMQRGAINEQSDIQSDSHPPNYLRININVQQYKEFYDTFGVKEGDNMYIADSERLSVW